MNYSNFDQALVDCQSLIQAIVDIRKKIDTVNGVSYASQDARHVALDGLICDIVACSYWIKTLMSLKVLSQEKNSNNWDEEYRRLIGTGLSYYEAEDLMIDYL